MSFLLSIEKGEVVEFSSAYTIRIPLGVQGSWGRFFKRKGRGRGVDRGSKGLVGVDKLVPSVRKWKNRR
jgi:hypothetical protein